jgi:hypothetical protein
LQIILGFVYFIPAVMTFSILGILSAIGYMFFGVLLVFGRACEVSELYLPNIVFLVS